MRLLAGSPHLNGAVVTRKGRPTASPCCAASASRAKVGPPASAGSPIGGAPEVSAGEMARSSSEGATVWRKPPKARDTSVSARRPAMP